MPTRRILRGFPTCIALLAVIGSGQAALQGDAEQAIRRSGLERDDVSICVIDAETGQRLVDINSQVPRIPASNMKLLTSGAAARLLGADYMFKTRLLLDDDRLVVVGDGDPAFGDSMLLERMVDETGRSLDVESFLSVWVDAVVADGTTSIDELIVDDRIFDREYIHPSWPREQLVKRYCAEVSGLMFHRNIIQFLPRPAAGGSTRADVTRSRPAVDFLEIRNQVTSDPKKRVTDLFDVQRAYGTNVFTMRGNVTRPMTPQEVTVHDMPTMFGRILAERLRNRGVRVESVRLANADDPVFEGRTIGPVVMTPLSQVLERCNMDSYNLYAEALLKKLGATYSRSSGSWENGTTVIRHSVQEHLPRPDPKLKVADGSGMSRSNQVSAATIAQWLASMDPSNPSEAVFIESLPEPGEGTLRNRFQDRGRKLDNSRILAKSGYLRRSCTLSGYVLDDRGRRLCFSILVNTPTNQPKAAKKLHEAVVLDLVEQIERGSLSAAQP